MVRARRFPFRSRPRAAAAVLVAWAGLSLAGCGRPAPPPAAAPAEAAASGDVQAPAVIGLAVGLTGANSVVAPTVVQSAQLAVDQINDSGGLLGRRVRLEVADDASSADGARAAIDALVHGRHAIAIIAMETSAAREAALPRVQAARIPYLYTSFYEGGACNPWLFVNGWVPVQQATPVVDYLAKDKHARSFYLVGSDYSFGRGMLAFAKRRIREDGGQVVGEDYLPIDDADWSAVVARIRAARPDALVSATAGGSPNVDLARALRRDGVQLPYANLAIDESTAKAMGELATGQLVSASYLTSLETTENREFLQQMLIRFGADLRAPNELSVPEYEAFMLYRAAVTRAGTIDPARVIAALAQVAFKGPRGRVQMDHGRHAALTMQLGHVRPDGTIGVLQTFADVSPGEACTAQGEAASGAASREIEARHGS